MQRYRASDWAEAVKQLEALAGDAPDYKDVAARLADARYELRQLQLRQRYDAAMERYRAAAWADAAGQLQALVADEPGFLDVSARLADAQHQLNLKHQVDDARAKLAAGNFVEGIAALTNVCSSDYAGAAQTCTQVAQAHRDFATDLVRRADVAFKARKWNDTERLSRQALEQDSNASGAHRLLGGALEKCAATTKRATR